MKINQAIKAESIVEEKIFTVSEFLDFLNRILRPRRVVVKGEVGEKMNNYPDYNFFNLLDKDGSILKCFAWKEVIEKLGIGLESGMEIRVVGHPEIRKNKGEFRFQVERIELIGEGILKKQFEILKKKLASEGYFKEEIKKSIPKFSQKIGLITSKYGKGAKKDFLTHLGKFGFRIFLYDVRVEGVLALSEIIEAINYFNQNFPKIDVLVLTRGGGSWESLQPFNSEEMVKAIFSSKIPIITGIGHEDDETLADLVADLRASTPTHAAKILNENWKLASIKIYEFENNLSVLINRNLKNFKENISFYEKTLEREMKRLILSMKENINELAKRINIYFQKEFLSKSEKINNLLSSLNFKLNNYFRKFHNLESGFKNNLFKLQISVKNHKEELVDVFNNLLKNRAHWTARIMGLLEQEEEKIIPSNPILKLKQGYTMTRDEFGKIIKDPSQLKISQEILTKFYKGQVLSQIKKIKK